MRKIVVGPALALAWALAAPIALAQEVAPDTLLEAVTGEVLDIIRQDKDIQAGNPAKVAALVESKILPHFDFARMTQISMARNWRLASPAQQSALTAEFRSLLVRTYSTALTSYRDQIIEFKPLRAAPGDDLVTVKSVIRQPGRPPFTIDYEMEKGSASWKVYDIRIEGVSLVTNYRETFAASVREGGIDGLIKSLTDKNRQSAQRASSRATVTEAGS